MNTLERIGQLAVSRLQGLNHGAAVLFAVFITAVNPRSWTRAVREALSRQIVSAGVDALGVISFTAFLAGILIVVQVQLWLNKVSQSRLLGPVLVTVVIREFGPVMANVVAIAGSGHALTSELANMTLSDQVRTMDARGLDPLAALVVPRVLGVTIATLCLTLVFIVVCLAGGYFFARIVNVNVGGMVPFAYSITRAIDRADLLNVVAKAVIPPLIWGTICCLEGLAIGQTAADLTTATSRSLRRSIISLFTIVTLVSVLTYT